MKVRELIHSLTKNGIDLDADVVYTDELTDTRLDVSSVGYYEREKVVNLNNTYSIKSLKSR